MTIARKQLDLDQPIVGKALTLEPVKQAHISAFAPFFKDEDALYYYLPSTLRQYDAHQLETLFKEWDNGETDVLLTIRRNDAVIGLMSVDNIDLANRNAEVGIALTDREMRGRGLAKAALQLLMTHLLDQKRLHRVYARVAVGNRHSRQLFESLGFAFEGTMRDALYRADGYLDMDLLGKVGE
ncbi:MAG TPA: GNAT family N-acetyltransferase [Fastidiosipila sp.]|nr:GNAT family N-acetyltransferase [Fastidiosipila sp.]